jgi:MFS superfamily sulfate permease-like transporter
VEHKEVERESQGTVSATPFPGIVVFRINESMTYPNSNFLGQRIKDWAETFTESGSGVNSKNMLRVKYLEICILVIHLTMKEIALL